MKKKRKLAQAAMEFLLSYGWAILVVLVVIGALSYYNVLDPTTLLPDKCILQVGPIVCIDHAVYFFTASNKVQFHIKFENQFDSAVQIKSIRMSRGEFECNQSYPDPKMISNSGTYLVFLCQGPLYKQMKKAGFDIKIAYFSTPGFDKTLDGEIFTEIKEIKGNPSVQRENPHQQIGDGNGDGVINQTDYDIINNLLNGRSDERLLDYTAYDLECDGVIGPPDKNIIILILNDRLGPDYLKAAKEKREEWCISRDKDPNWRP